MTAPKVLNQWGYAAKIETTYGSIIYNDYVVVGRGIFFCVVILLGGELRLDKRVLLFLVPRH